MATQHHTLARSTALQVSGKLIGTAVGLASFYVLVHGLGTDGFGALTTALTYSSVFAILVDFGLTLTTAQLISEKGANEERILGNLLTLRLVSGFIFLSIAPISSYFLPATPEIRAAILMSSISFFFGSTAQVFIGVFQKRLLLWRAVLAETVNRVTAFGLICLVAWLNLGIVAAAAAFAVGGIVQLILMLSGTVRHVRLWPRWESRVMRDIIARSWPVGASIFFNLIYLKGDIVFMWLFGRSETEIGLYGSAYKVIDVVTTVPTMFMGLMLPILAANWSSGQTGAVRTKLQSSFDTMVMLAIPFAAGTILVGEPLMAFIKPDLFEAGTVLKILGPTASAVFLGALYGHAVVAINRQRPMTIGYLAVAAIAITGYLVFIPTYGMYGAAWMSLLSEGLIACISFAVVSKVTGHVPGLGMAVRSLFATAIMAATILILPFHVILEIVLATGAYLLALGAAGGPSPRRVIGLFLPERPPINVP